MSRFSRRTSPWAAALRTPAGRVGGALVAVVVLLGVLAPLLTPWSPTDQVPGARLQPPSWEHPLGTDDASRDVLSRTLHGIRVDVLLAFLAVPAGSLLGCLLALVSLSARAADTLVQRALDVLLALPPLVLGIAVAAAVGPGLPAVALVVVAVEAPIAARLLRASMLVTREADYVAAARVAGLGPVRRTLRHTLPNAVDPVVVQLALAMSTAAALEGAMSFVGLGVQRPDPSLGSSLQEGLDRVTTAPALLLGPLVAITALVLGFWLLGSALTRSLRG